MKRNGKDQNAKAGFAAAQCSAIPKRMTEDEYVDFLVAQGIGKAQAKIFAAAHYHDPEDGSGDVGCDVNIGQQNEQADDHGCCDGARSDYFCGE